jgi:hypothetical protein
MLRAIISPYLNGLQVSHSFIRDVKFNDVYVKLVSFIFCDSDVDLTKFKLLSLS